MGSSKKQTVGYKYFMGLHFGLCHGPVDEVQQIKVGDREAWAGSVTDNATVSISKGELFGGKKKEGGIVGSLDLAMGGPTQTANSYLASKIGATIPAFRGILSAVWKGGQVSANNPYIKPWAFRVKRILQGWSTGTAWYPEKAAINVCSWTHNAECPGEVLDMSFDGSLNDAMGTTIVNNGAAIDGGHLIADGSAFIETASHNVNFQLFTCDFTIRFKYFRPEPDIYGNSSFGNFVGKLRDNSPVLNPNSWLFGMGLSGPLQFTYKMGGPPIVAITDSVPEPGVHDIELRFSKSTMTMDYYLDGVLRSSGIIQNGYVDTISPIGIMAEDAWGGPPRLGHGCMNKAWIDDLLIIKGQATPILPPAIDMNPAHIIYQCLTDGVWGMGYPISAIDNDSFTAAADKLYSEAFGLSMVWNKQDIIESFIKIVLDHIGGILYVDPSTGKFALKLIRDDYVKEDLPIYGPSNLISASDYQRQSWGETVNEISVVYTDALTGKDVSVTVQDLANIQTQGGVVAQTKQYPGVRCPGLAQRIAMRDLIVSSTPLAKIKLTATRKAWSIIPGDVIRLTWPEYGIEDVVYRVLEVNRGTLQNGEITIEAVEDVFGMPDNTYVGTQDGGWTDPNNDPVPSVYRKMIETPYLDLARRLTPTELAAVDPLSGYLQSLAVKPTSDAANYALWTATGSSEYEDRGDADFCPSAALSAELAKEETSSISFSDGTDIDLVEVGTYAVIDDEYVEVTAINADAGTATISRGVLDTVPSNHAAGAHIFFADGFQGVDQTEYADGEVVNAKLLTRTGIGELAMDSSPVDTLTMDQRQYRPYPPGKLRVNGLAYPNTIPGTAALSMTWAHRDRLSQTAYLVDQSEDSIGPETGTAYTIRVYGEVGDLVHTETAVSATSWTYDVDLEAAESGVAGTGTSLPGSVVLMLNMNGSDGSTTFTDDAGKAVTATGTIEIDTAQSKFGGASGYLNGGYLTVPDSADWVFGTSDFTIELWCRWASNTTAIFACQDVDPSNIWFFKYYYTVPRLEVGIKNAGSWVLDWHDATWTPTNNTWHHIALTRSGNTLRIFVDGVQKGSTTYTGSFPDFAVPLKIGATHNWTGYTTTAHFDAMRIVKGGALYTADFTPPATEPTTSLVTPGDGRINGKLRVELESVRYAGPIFAQYAVPQITGWDGTNWIGTLGLADAYLYKADSAAGTYTSLNLNLPYAMVAYGNGIYLALSANGPCKTSADGVTWTDQTGAPTGVQKLVYMGSQFVALGLYTIHTTTDGVSWTLKATLSYRPIDIAYSGSLWMVVGNHKTATQVFAATSSDLITWTDVSPTLTHWNGSNFLAEITSYGGKLQADFECVIYSGSAFYIGGRFVVDIEDQYRFHPLVYKYQSGVFTDCCPPLFGPVVVGSGYSVTSLAVVDTKIVAAGFRIAANATLATLTYSSWSMCTMPSTPAGVLDTSVWVTGNGTDAVLTTHMGGSNLITADGITFTATTGSIENNPVAVAPSGGVTSWQKHNHEVRRTGYGFNYGMYYG